MISSYGEVIAAINVDVDVFPKKKTRILRRVEHKMNNKNYHLAILPKLDPRNLLVILIAFSSTDIVRFL